ncbi:MAG: response regulator [Pseudomonadota bacterium]
MARILILEDDEAFGPLLQASLEDAGHTVSLYASATIALAHVDQDDPELVIADILVMKDGKLTEDGGIKLISTLKQLQRRTAPVIAISGVFAGELAYEAQTTAMTVGADHALAKPFVPEDLIALVNELLTEH